MEHIKTPVYRFGVDIFEPGWRHLFSVPWDPTRDSANDVAEEIVRVLNVHADLLAACEEAYEFLDDRTDTYPEPCEDVPALSVMIGLKFAIDKAKGDQCPS